jgi:hypothetical protein
VTVPLAALPPLQHDPGRIRELVTEQLARPEFEEREPGPIARLLREVVDRVTDAIARVLTGATGTDLAAWTVVAIAVVVLLVVVWRLTATSTVDRRRAVVPDATPGRTSASWRVEADEHARDGRHAEELRARYRAAITALVEAGVIEDVPGRTVRELDAAIATAAPDLAVPVADAGAAFEAVWYGHADPSEDHRDAVRAADGAARTLGSRGPTVTVRA